MPFLLSLSVLVVSFFLQILLFLILGGYVGVVVGYGPITIAIRARFELDSATTRYEMRTIRVRFEHATTSYEELCAFEQ